VKTRETMSIGPTRIAHPSPANRQPQQKAGETGAFILISVLCLALAGCGGGDARPGLPRDAGAQVDAVFAPFTSGESPGAAVMVIRDGEVAYEAGYGYADLEHRVPITPQTNFELASVSKQFTAVAVMILAERGRLSYDDSMVEYLPELARFGDRITIRHLLTHTSGLPDYYDALEQQAGETMPDTEQAMRFLAGWGEPLFPAGERYEYSNPGYEMLALVVERASGQGFGEFLHDNIFAPLGMTGTVVRDSSEPQIAHRARGYTRKGGTFELLDHHPLNHIVGSGSIYSSVEDLARWDRALEAGSLVRRSTLEVAWSPVQLTAGEHYPYGFGWRLGRYGGLGHRVYHAGGWVGFSTFIVRYPERRFTVIVLSNLDESDGEEFAGRITDIFYPSSLITDATVVDGTGKPRFTADIRIEGARIVAVGDLEPAAGEPVVDASGLALAPGFIDSHSHDDDAIFDLGDAVAAVSQGITTTVVGQDGDSRLPLRDFFTRLEAGPPAINVASYAGHGTLRTRVMGEDFTRAATATEIESMEGLLAEEMDAGALGLSTGLEYKPGIYSTTAEVVALARVAAAHGGRYISHIRSEDRRFWEALDEILTIGREAALPVQVSHVKLAMRSVHGQTDRLLAALDAARSSGIDVTVDLYPYTYWQSTPTVLFPDRDFDDRRAALFAVDEITAPDQMLFTVFAPDPELAGKTLAEIAALRGTDPAATLMDLSREAETLWLKLGPEVDETRVADVIATSMAERDIERLMTWPFLNFCTDGELDGAHPRGYGSFTRVLGRYVRERRVLTLEDAIYKMTGRAAANLGLRDRGRIAAGAFADLVLFDPATVLDRATPEQPHSTSIGIEMVWVNGRLVYQDGRASGRKPGMVLRRQPVS
jgi:N-acyl-D-aspartate/D-glutamate deacylase/CubicO group peptidase (beta-lactamase class C family)